MASGAQNFGSLLSLLHFLTISPILYLQDTDMSEYLRKEDYYGL